MNQPDPKLAALRYLSRRDFITRALMGAGGVIVIAACSPADTGATTTGAGPGTTALPGGTTTTVAEDARFGGILRLGTLGGANDLLDGQHIVSKADIARTLTGWEPLLNFDPDFVPENQYSVAEEVEVVAADNYVIHLKEGIEFHNGQTMTADDVVYSLNRMLDPDAALFGGSALRPVLDPSGITKIDDLTVGIQLLQPVSIFKDLLCGYTTCIVPDGYERFAGDPTNQIGTGPYKLAEFEVGVQSIHVKHENYWRAPQPYFDEVHIIDFADGDSLVNALIADQIDVVADIPPTAVDTLTGAGMNILNSSGGGWLTMVMAVDQEPFTDVRVRQAMRLIVDRDVMLNQVMSGFGRVANDLYSPLDACYLGEEVPQRAQDIEAAMALLADAGQSDLVIDLFAPNDTAGLPEMVTAFAEMAAAAGITVNPVVLDGGTYWGEEYLKRTFATDFWGTRSFLLQVAASSLPSAPYPGDHWPPADSDFIAKYNAALAETDDEARCAIQKEMQQELYDEGGLIIPFFQNQLDGFNARLQGLVERPNTLNLDHYGRGYQNLYFS
ncbi:MAG: ABC transporter substrate-binding protein, partial [Actinobacteria bacterium]|nr:ABC transporter substrate-binding protein [Actinomycetota bacterium]